MTYAQLREQLIRKHGEETAKGWNGIDGVESVAYGIPCHALFAKLGDDDFERLEITLDDPGVVAFAYLGEGLHPAVLLGRANAQVEWGRRVVGDTVASTIDNGVWLGCSSERPVLEHLLGYAAGRDDPMDRGLLRGSVE